MGQRQVGKNGLFNFSTLVKQLIWYIS